jgi:hypothetical protein
MAEVDSRNLAMNHFSPSDETIDIELFNAAVYNSGAGNSFGFDITVDGAAVDSVGSGAEVLTAAGASYYMNVSFKVRTTVAAGKHRIAVRWKTNAGTLTMDSGQGTARLHVSASRGK